METVFKDCKKRNCFWKNVLKIRIRSCFCALFYALSMLMYFDIFDSGSHLFWMFYFVNVLGKYLFDHGPL